jgi:hypothetical protein
MTTDLEAYDEYYDNAEVNDQFEPVPDGTYQVFVDEITLKETQKTPVRPMLSWQFKVMVGGHEGRILFKNSVIPVSGQHDIARAMSYIKTDFSICGLKLKKFSELQEHLGLLRNMHLEVKVANKGENQNVYIQRKLEAGQVGADANDNIPFN